MNTSERITFGYTNTPHADGAIPRKGGRTIPVERTHIQTDPNAGYVPKTEVALATEQREARHATMQAETRTATSRIYRSKATCASSVSSFPSRKTLMATSSPGWYFRKTL